MRNQISFDERIDLDTTGGFSEEQCAQTVWGLRYIDDVVLRRTDTNQDYDYADAGERTDYFLTDPQFSVVAVVDSTGKLQERLAYSAYGEATHHFPADMDGDGDVDSIDTNWFTNLNNLKNIDESGYNPDGDLNRDGTVNTADLIIAFNWNGTAALANGLISDPNGPDNPIGYDGYLFNAETKLYTVRFRHYEPVMGRWVERDPLGYVDGMNLAQYTRSQPVLLSDPLGLNPNDKHFGLPKNFWNWYHRWIKNKGDPDLTADEARELYEEYKTIKKNGGKTLKDGKRYRGKRGRKGTVSRGGLVFSILIGGTLLLDGAADILSERGNPCRNYFNELQQAAKDGKCNNATLERLGEECAQEILIYMGHINWKAFEDYRDMVRDACRNMECEDSEDT